MSGDYRDLPSEKQSRRSTIRIENFLNQVNSPLLLFQLWNDLHCHAHHHLVIEHWAISTFTNVLRKLKITCESSALPGSATSQPKEVGFKSVSKKVSTNFLCDKYGHCSDNKIKLPNNINSTQCENLLLPVLSSTAWSCCPRSRTSLEAEIVELKHSSCKVISYSI